MRAAGPSVEIQSPLSVISIQPAVLSLPSPSQIQPVTIRMLGLPISTLERRNGMQ